MNWDWDKVKQTIGSAAPLIGTLIGGPAGGAVATLAAQALGVDETPEAIGAAITSDPGALMKLKELEFTYKTRLEELVLESEKALMADRQNARRAEVERLKAGGSNRFMYALAVLVTVGFFVLCGVLIFRSTAIPEGSREVAFVLFGTLSTAFGAVMQYFFGSSKGSSDKMSLLSSQGKLD